MKPGLDLMALGDPFQLRMFCDSAITRKMDADSGKKLGHRYAFAVVIFLVTFHPVTGRM